MSLPSTRLVLASVLAMNWTGGSIARQVVFRLPENDPNTNSEVIRSAAFSPDGLLLAVGYGRFTGLLQEPRPGQVVLWEARTGKRTAALAGRADGVCAVAFTPDGKSLVSAEYPGILTLWDVPSGRERGSIKAPAWVVGAIGFSPDGKLLAAGLWTGAIDGVSPPGNVVVLWNAESGKLIRTLTGHSDAIRTLSFSPDGRHLASGSMDGTAKIWDVANGKPQATLESPSLRGRLGRGSPIGIESLAFSPDGRTLVLAAGSVAAPGKAEGVGEVTLWVPPAGPMRTTLKGLECFIQQVTFSPDGRWLATAGGDRWVRLWDVSTLQDVGKLKGTGPVAFSPDGTGLVWGSAERTLAIRKIAVALREQEE